MNRWEHEQVRVEVDELDKYLTTYGQAGWELVAVIRIPWTDNAPVRYRLFFKRRFEPGMR